MKTIGASLPTDSITVRNIGYEGSVYVRKVTFHEDVGNPSERAIVMYLNEEQTVQLVQTLIDPDSE